MSPWIIISIMAVLVWLIFTVYMLRLPPYYRIHSNTTTQGVFFAGIEWREYWWSKWRDMDEIFPNYGGTNCRRKAFEFLESKGVPLWKIEKWR